MQPEVVGMMFGFALVTIQIVKLWIVWELKRGE